MEETDEACSTTTDWLLIIFPPPSSPAVVVVSSGEVLDDIPVIRQCSSLAFLAIERIANF